MITSGMYERVFEYLAEGYKVVVEVGEFGPQAYVEKRGEKVLVAWQIPDTDGLTESQNRDLYVCLPLTHGSDSETVDHFLLRGGFSVVSETNYIEAYSYVQGKLREEMWVLAL